ncbi:hypothetical protein [Mesorhizobium kowhaii]|nr:hypothetical protein [Mesorhizobium kowhaii]
MKTQMQEFCRAMEVERRQFERTLEEIDATERARDTDAGKRHSGKRHYRNAAYGDALAPPLLLGVRFHYHMPPMSGIFVVTGEITSATFRPLRAKTSSTSRCPLP